MTDYPSISVVIPSYNQGQFIGETIQSVIDQQYPNLEILVLDGGSTDNTVEVIEQYIDRLTYWHSKKDKGQADAINQGMRLSSGEIVCWLNSDDMYLPGTLLEIGQRFRGLTDQNYVIYGDTQFLYEERRPRGARKVQYAAPYDPLMLAYYDYIAQPSAFWTRKLWEETGELDLRYHYVLDWEWFLRAGKIAQFEYVPKLYSIYRIHTSHKSSSGGIRRKQEVLDVVKTYASEYWIDLYQEVDRCYPTFKPWLKRLRKLGIPHQEWLLSQFVPALRSKLQHVQDLSKVLAMYA
ncbi:family 2 glycosyl transferase [Leptolyngbya boryana NIES-2135]|jgi:glycosyltransferase involved in cell wall biosynthesis|uniref:Family 2 glycosyl transferase n=1 Tax=Leptolyngbya boryana NIES-2135 TaxID=1973484 RepID=A0A1Z4JBG5_LEPBY|nr:MULTISPECIES: glycosyltransferase family 2 protein [Leptolyngbya]BAY54086.1 family 2 glycosyl transferase [Leptolyngbya boryana NIES-2135]MBD2369743.1 glycosyltransferase [Leptolyngbya sp. FACHB-161]MBD2376056.1 glycosyltransferase [Leptolyngbya sp. FACHB-238]MBD2400332.1 glycosyltransferase [Leptolyngbya sp. FACHB-239]MBD2406873.1 glycosyltransferase [Leptolyngbya sp. FACHB-402]